MYDFWRGGRSGSATIRAAVRPMSMKQTTLSSCRRGAGRFPTSAAMLAAAALARRTVMNPVLGTPVGTGVGSAGARAMATPTA